MAARAKAALQAAPAREEITRIVESVVTSLRGDIGAADVALFAEIRSLAAFIEDARAELVSLRPEDIRTRDIPSATDELDAIVAATEQATNGIMAAAEGVESVAAELDGERARRLVDAVTSIYEACSFQDITGQRITKVVRTLQHIERAIATLVRTFGGEVAPAGTSEPDDNSAGSERQLLNGPALPGDAASQDDIDALFAKTG